MHHGFGALTYLLGTVLFFATVSTAAVADDFVSADDVTAFGNSTPSVCERFTNRAKHRSLSRASTFRFAFDNDGGLFNAGVCWWHSRFQRSVWALAEFRPNMPKPSLEGAKEIISALAHFRGVQVIPGYGDFKTFSADYKKEIQAELDAWQIRDGILNQSWFRGLSGSADLGRRPDRMRKIMDDLYSYYVKGAVENFFPWVMLQLTGIDAHASLIVGMVKQPDGYLMEIVDSNFPDVTTTWSYRYGDGQLRDSKYDTVPYRGLHRDVTAMKKALKSYCLPSSSTKTSRWPDASQEATQEALDDLEPYLGNEAAFRE